jgi:hypothetical protein
MPRQPDKSSSCNERQCLPKAIIVPRKFFFNRNSEGGGLVRHVNTHGLRANLTYQHQLVRTPSNSVTSMMCCLPKYPSC